MDEVTITHEELDAATASAMSAMLGIRSLNDKELLTELVTLYLKGFKAGKISNAQKPDAVPTVPTAHMGLPCGPRQDETSPPANA